jgi:long-chain fatty acid transport protein
VSNQTLFKPYKQDSKVTTTLATLIDESYSQDTPTWILPNVYLAYNFGQMGMGKLAVYGELGIVAGGGSLEWDGTAGVMAAGFSIASTVASAVGGNGWPTATDVTVEGSSVYYKAGAGVSYSFLEDMVSVSAGVRYVYADRSGALDGRLSMISTVSAVGAYTVDVDSEWDYTAKGYTPVFGLAVKPMKELTLAARFEMETKLEFEYEQKKNTVTNSLANSLLNAGVNAGVATMLNKDGVKANQNLPQILSLGAEYLVMPELTVGLTGTIYWMNKADMEGYEDYFNTGYEVALGATYKVMNELKVGGSVMYTSQSAKDELLTDKSQLITVSGNPVLDSWFFGVGASYTVIPNLDLTLALSWVHYVPEDADVTLATGVVESVSYKKDVYNIALGASYRM